MTGGWVKMAMALVLAGMPVVATAARPARAAKTDDEKKPRPKKKAAEEKKHADKEETHKAHVAEEGPVLSGTGGPAVDQPVSGVGAPRVAQGQLSGVGPLVTPPKADDKEDEPEPLNDSKAKTVAAKPSNSTATMLYYAGGCLIGVGVPFVWSPLGIISIALGLLLCGSGLCISLSN